MTDARVKLSITLITRNEAANIGRTLAAVRGVADDIVVVDSGSTDDTVTLAEAGGARVVVNPWSGYGAQKRFAETQAHHDWVLNLDADEVVTPELVTEIKALLAAPPPLPGYRIKIRYVYPGRPSPRLWADYHNYIRLYDRRAMRFRDSPVHDTVDPAGHAVGQLSGTVVHFSAQSFAHMKQKLEAYTDLQATALKKGRAGIALRFIFEYPAVFLRFYLLRRHFTGGWRGLYCAHLSAEARVGRLVKMWKASSRA